MSKNKTKNFTRGLPKGFTLLELLVVIGIIGLLASIIVVNLTGARKKARDIKRVADIRTIQPALESYYGKNGYYPTALSAMVGATAELPKRPTDPIAEGACADAAADNTDDCYYYEYNTPTDALGPQLYHVGASLEEKDSSLLKQDTDCLSNAATDNKCPVSAIYTSGGFSGADASSCDTTDNTRYCYDIAQ